ncbi:MAG: hypothetical protein AAGF99_00385 [Bacteroidota bacterium]
MSAQAEMPRYRSHKVVWALRVKSVRQNGPVYTLSFEEPDFADLEIGPELGVRVEPGGYLVQYEDGYRSWSPAEPFEAGYMPDGPPPLEGLHVSVAHFVPLFAYGHLPAHLRAVSEPFGALAFRLMRELPSNAETTVALRKLLEAKDAAVRAVALYAP